MPLEIVEAALDEAATAMEHYGAISLSLGVDFGVELARSMALIESQPRAWARVGSQRSELRKRVMARFPYSLIYQVEPDRVRVLAVMHQRQRPGYWRTRL